MELICTGCFTRPVAVHRDAEHDFVDMLVCNLGAADLPHGVSVHEALRCSYCGSPVHLDHRHMAWYEA
jgi:hypothetical protein